MPITSHLDHLRLLGRSPGTITARRRALTRMTALLPVPLLDATPADLLGWRAGLDLTPGAISNYVHHARMFYLWALSKELIGVDPSAGLPIPRTGRRLPRPIGEGDLLEALDCAPRRIRPWLVLAGCAGLRACEIAYLRAEYIMLRAPRPAIFIAQDATKGLTEHVVPLATFVCAELEAHGLPASGWAFRRHDGERGPNTPQLVSHLCNSHLHACGITSTLHKLRHRFATQFYDASGHDLLALRDVLGHRSIQSTTVYTLVSQPAAAAAVNAIPVPRLPGRGEFVPGAG